MSPHRAFRTLLPALLAFFVTAARADFEFTKWGMSAVELEKVGGGAVTPAIGDGIFSAAGRKDGSAPGSPQVEAVYESGYETGSVTYQAVYYFGPAGLFLVRLVPLTGEDASAVVSSLEAQYGAPDSVEHRGRVGSVDCIERQQWRATSENNLITYQSEVS